MARRNAIYRPTQSGPAWDAVRPFFDDVIVEAARYYRPDPTRYRPAVAGLLLFCHGEAIPLTAETAFALDAIQRFVTVACRGRLSPGTCGNYRTWLTDIARVLRGPDAVPGRGVPIPASDPVAPYSDVELKLLNAWWPGLPGLARPRVRALLACGAGVGMTASEFRVATGRDVRAHEHGVEVVVHGKLDRLVLCNRRYERHLLDAAELVGDGPLWTGSAMTRNSLNELVARAKRRHAGPVQLSMVRLRTSWIVAGLNAGLFSQRFAELAGITPEALAEYVRWADPIDSDRLLKGLRDGAPSSRRRS